jgi:L-alanine-DL-glutamate epimerase-like enolase superfamily enzyme
VASGRAYCPHFLAGGIGQLASLHLLAAVRGDGLLEIDANPNPLRSLLTDPVLLIRDGTVAPPVTLGLGIEPDIEALSGFVVLKLEQGG